jgi:hypothetical protein
MKERYSLSLLGIEPLFLGLSLVTIQTKIWCGKAVKGIQ